MLIKLRHHKKIIGDMVLNICAAALPIAVLQLVIYPCLSQNMEEGVYGLMLTFYSFWVVVSNSLGNVLNNIRLLNANEYSEKKVCGDYNLLLRRYLAVNVLMITVLTIVYTRHVDMMEILLSIIIASLLLVKAYMVVSFRLALSYKNILIDNIFQTIGFIAGALIFNVTGVWQMVYLLGFLSSCVFLIVRTGLLREPWQKTELYLKVRKDADIYTVATFSASAISYVDKLVLYPLMGGEIVSIYYTATIMGKIISMVSGPVTSVILSYIAKWEQKEKKIFLKVLFWGIVISIFTYFATLAVSNTVIRMLFPQWVDEVMIYLPVTTIAVLVQSLNSFLHPFVLKFYNIRWQVAINVCSIVVYVCAALVLWNAFGLMGFCIGTIIGNLSKTIIMTLVHICSAETLFVRKACE